MRNFEKVKENLRVDVVNYEKNAEALKNVPHRCFLDLAIRYKLEFRVSDTTEARAVVTNWLKKEWNITEQELLDVAYHNTFRQGVAVLRMMDMLELVSLDENALWEDMRMPDSEEFMYVARTMSVSKGGASCLLMKEVFQNFAKEKNADIYILPSSVDELILVVDRPDMRWDYLKAMVSEVNKCSVPKEMILSDHLYKYQKDSDEIIDLCREE